MSVYSLDSLENEPISILLVPEAYETSHDKKLAGNGQNCVALLAATRLENASSHDKKLGGAARRQRRPASYLELYRRRFTSSAPPQSREGSGLSTCGSGHDVARHRLKEPMASSSVVLAAASGEDRKSTDEMSFYRGLLEQQSTFRPYTLGEYRQITAATALVMPRSLPPDSDSLLAKREALVRRRSYGDAASAVNRARISSSTKRNPPLPQPHSKNRSSTEVPAEPNRRVSKRQSSSATVSTAGTASSSIKTVTGISRDSVKRRRKKKKKDAPPSLHELSRRHFNEKRMIDQLVKRTLSLV